MSDSLRPHGLQHAGLPVHHQLPEFTQTHVHWVGDAIQPSHPLSSPSPPAPNPSQHQSLFQWVNSLHQVPKVLGFQLQHQSFQWIFSTDLLQNGLVGSPCSPRDSQESSPTPQFRSINSSALSFLYSPTLIAVQNDIVQLSHPYKVIHTFQSHHSNYSGRRTDCGKSTRLTLYLFHDPDTGDNTVVQKDHTNDGHNGYVKKALSKRERRRFPGGPVVENPLANVWDTGSIPWWGRSQVPPGQKPRT